MSTKTKSDPVNYTQLLNKSGGDKMMVDEVLRNLESQSFESQVKLIFKNVVEMDYQEIRLCTREFIYILYYLGSEEANATAEELEKVALLQDDREIVFKYLELLQQMKEIKRYLDRLYPDRVSHFEEQIDIYESRIKEKYYMIIDNHIDNEKKPVCCGSCNLF